MQPTEFLSRLSLPERGYIRERLRDETFGGILLLVAAAIALVWSNSAWASGYQSFINFEFGPNFLHLHLSVAEWASDGLLAVFFFVIGLELKHELVLGSLSNIRKAAVPVAAAIGGMFVPALIFVIINVSTPRCTRWLGNAYGHRYRLCISSVGSSRQELANCLAGLLVDARSR